MLKNKVLAQLQGVLDEWLLGFNSNEHFSVSAFSTEKFNLKNAIINPNTFNAIMEE